MISFLEQSSEKAVCSSVERDGVNYVKNEDCNMYFSPSVISCIKFRWTKGQNNTIWGKDERVQMKEIAPRRDRT
jgi:hypothetical protein